MGNGSVLQTSVSRLHNDCGCGMVASLTSIVLREHGQSHHLSEGLDPLPLVLLPLTHEHKLPVRRLQNDPTSPLVA